MFKKVFAIVCFACSLSSVSWSEPVQVPFKARFDFKANSLQGEIPLSDGEPIYFEVQQDEDSAGYKATVNIKKWQGRFFDISAFLAVTVDPVVQRGAPADQSKWSLVSRYTLINSLPFDDIVANGICGNGVFAVERAVLGGMILEGQVTTSVPHAVDMKVSMVNVDLNDVLPLLGFEDLNAQGTIGGALRLTGNVPEIRVKGEIHSFNGNIEALEYYSMNLNIDGIYPEVYVIDSQIAQMDGFAFGVDGKLNFSQPESFAQQIRSFIRKPLVQKNRNTVEWTLKKLKSGEDDAVTEFKYLKRRKDERMGGDSDMLGIERRMEF